MSDFDKIGPQLPDPFRLLWREKVSSSNDEVRLLAENGIGEGLVLVAEEQFSGRGRRGAEWFSPSGESLAFSVLLRPKVAKEFWHRFSLVAGLAVAEALEKFVPLVEIKWPNDVIVGGKKIAGILVESGNDFVIVGIGINVNTEEFPEGLAATSLCLEVGESVAREDLLLGVINRLAFQAARLDEGFDGVVERIGERCYLTGNQVSLKCADQKRQGLVKGIGPGGELLLECGGKTEKIFQADEVRIIEE